MRVAPIQLGEVSFRRVSVELDASRLQQDGVLPGTVSDCDGVDIGTQVSFSQMEDHEAGGSRFFVVLRVQIENKASEGEVRFSPYLVDVEAGAVIRALPGAEVLGDIEDLVVVNGTSLLWSSIREHVCSLTARMPAGVLMLPTVNFQDLRRDRRGEAGHE